MDKFLIHQIFFIIVNTQILHSRVDVMTENSISDLEYKLYMKDYVFFEITYPEEIAFTYKASASSFSPSWNSSYEGVALVPTDPPCACGAIRNQEEVEGRIVLIERGDCSFVSKVVRAEESGAVGAIITDTDIHNDDLYISMIDDTTDRRVSIPAIFLLGKNGQIILRSLERAKLSQAVINIPINITNIKLNQINQPPWMVW